MTIQRTIVYAILALLIAIAGQLLWPTLFNPFVWHLTYLGIQLARAIHEPDYDSVASARMFNAMAVLLNGVIYFVVLSILDRIAGFRLRKAARS